MYTIEYIIYIFEDQFVHYYGYNLSWTGLVLLTPTVEDFIFTGGCQKKVAAHK